MSGWSMLESVPSEEKPKLLQDPWEQAIIDLDQRLTLKPTQIL
jgi:hypothetical protein